MMDNEPIDYHTKIGYIMYGSYIRYDKMYELTKYAFYGKTDSNDVNIFIDVYSILKSLYSRGLNFEVDDYCCISSCIINLAIHLRAYFETRHGVNSTIFIIYGGARVKNCLETLPDYNAKNIIAEESNSFLKDLIQSDLNVVNIICPYLQDIYCIIDYENEFSTIASHLIDTLNAQNPNSITPNIIYSRDMLSYQLVAFKPRTFLYRVKKKFNMDCSWVVTKSNLYDVYRYNEIGNTKHTECGLDVLMLSVFLSIAGVKSRNISSIKSSATTIRILEDAVNSGIFFNGYNSNSIFYHGQDIFNRIFDPVTSQNIMNRFKCIDLPYQTSIYASTIKSKEIMKSIINLYSPDEVRAINNKYFQKYPLDLNRV